MTYSWLSPLLVVGARRTLTVDDCWPTPRSTVQIPQHVQQVQTQVQQQGKPLMTAMHGAVGWLFWQAAIFRGVSEVFSILSLLTFQQVLRYCQGRPTYLQLDAMYEGQFWISEGLLMCLCLFAFALIQSLALNQFIDRVFNVGMQVQTSVLM